ncbi:MAG: hypothetical protein ABH830_01475 [Patescibacteria group bacterium]
MRKAFFIFLLCLLAVSLSSCKKTDQPQEQQQANQEQNQEEEESFFGSMKDLLTRGKSLKCTYEETRDDGTNTTGVLYIADNKAKSEIEILDGDERSEAFTLFDGDWIYTWASFLPNGTKMNTKELPQGEDYNVQKETDTLEKEMGYKCSSWVKDSSKFQLPDDVEFKDVTEAMADFSDTMEDFTPEDAQTMQEDASERLCEVCDMAPEGEARDECKKNAGCE